MELLLLHPGGLGDVILSLPAVALLRETFPSARITVAGNIDHLVPAMHGYADDLKSLSTLPLHNLYTDTVLPDSDIRFWKSFDPIISWTGSSDARFVQKLKSICPNARIASWRPDPQESRHVSQLFIDSLGLENAAGRKAIEARVRLRPGLSDQGAQWLKEQGWRAGEPLVALHPGAGSEAKRWPSDRFIEMARHLTQTEKKRLVIIEGPAERGLAAQIAQKLPENKLILARSLPLETLAPVIAKAIIFVGNDSGISHLAAALGVPSVVLFGPTLPKHWAPLGRHVKIVQADCLDHIRFEEVIQIL